MSIRNLIELILLAMVWGASYMFMRIATPEFGAIALIEIRVLVASLFLLPIWIFREGKSSTQQVKQFWWPIFVIGTLNSAVPFVLFAYSTLSITGGFASILNSTAPIWAALVAWLWLKKKLNFNGILGLLLGLIGVAILVSGSLSFDNSAAMIGIIAAVSASLLYGISANYTTEKLSKVSPLTISTFSQIGAMLVLLPLAIYFFPTEEISSESWLAVLALGVFCTGFAYTMYFRLIANVGSTKAITVTFLIPIFGTMWGALFLDEEVTQEMIVGTLIILLGTALVTGILSARKVITK